MSAIVRFSRLALVGIMASSLQMPAMKISVAALNVLITLFLLILIITFIRRRIAVHGTLKHQGLANFAMLILLMFAIYPFTCCVVSVSLVVGPWIGKDVSGIEHAIMIPTFPFYFMSLSLMVLLFTLQLRTVFRDTQFAMDNKCACYLCFHAVLLFLLVVLMPLALLFSTAAIIPIMVLGTWLLLHTLLSVTLMVLFTRRMYHFVQIEAKSEMETTRDLKQTDDAIRQVKLLRVAIKHPVLICTANISTMVSSAIIALILSFDDPSIRFASQPVYCLDAAVNVLCIVLLFAFNDAVYNKLCSPVHQCCMLSAVQKLSIRLRSQSQIEMNERETTA